MSAPKKARKEGLTLKQAEDEFLGFIERIQPKDVAGFLNWVQTSFSTEKEDQKPKDVRDAMETLTEISHSLREKVPVDGQLQTEDINYPTEGFDSDCNSTNTVHVDCFLYDEDDIEDLVEQGKLTRTYCLDCGSKNTKPLTFISHSLAPAQLEFVFTQLVPLKEQAEDFSVVDIGSRLGAVIYAAGLLGRGNVKATGIELNEDLCKLQNDIIKNFNLENVAVVCSDVRKQAGIISKADLVVMNNVFSFFMSHEEQTSCWEFLKANLKKNCLLLHNPDLKDITAHLKLSFTIDQWLKEISTAKECATFAGGNEDLFEDCGNLHFYRIK